MEYTKEAVSGKTLVMTTSNGTQAILKAQGADMLYIGAMLNATIVAKELMQQKKDVVLLCAGTKGRFSLDDCVTTGYIIDRMIQHKGRRTIRLDDLGYVCYDLFERYKDNLNALVSNAVHYGVLTDLGMQNDIDYCLTPDSVDVLPRFEDGRIALD